MLETVFVTGGSRGIGEAVVRMFAGLGKRVAFTFHSSASNAEKICSETGAFAVHADLNDSEQLEAAVKEARAHFAGGIDILINNAGISQEKLLLDIEPHEWGKMIQVNTTAVYTATHAVLPDMIHKDAGRIINISSIWGIHGASCEVHYSASKAAVIGFTKALAQELKLTGITVNCISPGVIDTDMNAWLKGEERAQLISEIPAGRMGTAEEVAKLVCFLASDWARALNGQVITIDGGYTL